MIPKLIINGIDIPIVKELPVSVNLAISDVRDLDKKGGTLTKTLVLSGTQEVVKVFEYVFRLNVELSTFNPNLSVEGIYYLNEKEQIKGDVQLIKIIDKPNGSRDFHCNIIGREGKFFVSVGDALLTDLDFSDLDHTYNKTEQKNSWATSYRLSGVATAFAYGSGYVYPMIKYGKSASDTIYDVTHFKPAIAVKEYVDRIVAAAGYTYTSTFLTSTLFKHLYIPCNREKLELSNTAINNSQYFIGKTTSASATLYTGTTSSNTAAFNNIAVYPNYDLETGTYFDSSNQYDSVTNFYATIGTSGVYNVVAFCQLDITINSAALVGGTWNAATTFYDTYIEINTGAGWVIVGAIANLNTATTQAIGASKSYKSNCQTGNISLTAGTLVRVRSRIAVTATLFDSLSAPAANGTAYTADYVIPNGTQKNEHFLLLTGTEVIDGNSLEMNNTIPQNIKQQDFFKWIMQMFKLNVELDKTNETNLIIEPESSGWYTANVEDWTTKADYLKEWETKPIGDLDFKSYVWKYKPDKDYYNDKYDKAWIDNYGLKRIDINNDFIKNEKKIEIGFSPTPLVANSSNNIICPHIYSSDGVNIKPTSHNIRILYYGGLKNSGNAWSYTGATSGTTSELQYPYIGHVDDPLTPTFDLNFEYPNEVFYSFILAYYTTNNLYNAYYSQFINEITDKDSKIITAYIRLTELDISQFTFRNKVFINHPEYGGAYFIVNKIFDYNPLDSKSTKVELLKLKRHDAFVTDTIAIDPAYDPVATSRIAYNPETNDYVNTNTGNTLSIGTNNRVLGIGNSANGGDRNFIDETSYKVKLINCIECSVVGATNLTVIGASNMAFDSTYDNTTYIANDVTISGIVDNFTIIRQSKTASFTVDPSINVYEIDCTAGNITATYNSSVYTYTDKIIYFKRVDSSANTFSIDDASGTPTIDGNAVPWNTGAVQWDDIPVLYNGTNFRIL